MLFPVTSHTHWYTTPTTRVAKAMPKRFKRGKKRVRFSVGAEESDGVVQEESEVMEVVEQGDEEEEGNSIGEEAGRGRGHQTDGDTAEQKEEKERRLPVHG